MLPTTLTLFNLERILRQRIKIYYQIIKHNRSSDVRSVVLNPELTGIQLGMNMYVEDVSISQSKLKLKLDQHTAPHVAQQAINPVLTKA